ncbi:MAG: cation diffusion facilitator family transporter [Caldilineaceae bacterium]|nr:cation diffusion facilitator family transporter [Caldilineaceae bacterium]HRJ43128.1 cation diffusion facilitator family transporter [Caldilineaceae bacterium]
MNRDHRAIERVLLITFALNLLATAAKLGVGIWTGALSLIADGLDTLFDGLSNVVGIAAVRKGSQPPDDDHPYGHRKFETLAALLIATLLFITAWELATGAIERLRDPHTPLVNLWSVLALTVGGAIQGCTGLWEMRRGRALGSEVLVADARHTIASLYVSFAVLFGLGLVWLGYAWADPLVALLVAAVIAKIGVETLLENIPALVDQATLDPATIAAVVADVAGVESFHRIRSRGATDDVAIDLHVRVDRRLSMQAANAIADEVRRRLLALPGVTDVTVHAEAQSGPESALEIQQAVALAVGEEGLSLHELWAQQTDGSIALHLHVGVDPNLSLAQAHGQVDRLESTIRSRLPQVAAVHSHIETASADVLPTARVSRGLQERIEAAVSLAAEAIPGLSDPHEIQVYQVEGQLFITAEALVDGALPVAAAHALSTELQRAVQSAVPNVGEVLVHLEPIP